MWKVTGLKLALETKKTHTPIMNEWLSSSLHVSSLIFSHWFITPQSHLPTDSLSVILDPFINTVLMSSTSSPPVVRTPNRRNTNPPSYSDLEEEKTHKVDQVYAFVSNANNSKAILNAFIANVTKKGSKGRKEQQPAGSPTCVPSSTEIE